MDLTEAASRLQTLDHGDLTGRLAALEASFYGQDAASAHALCSVNGISESLVEAAFVLKAAAGQINVIIHAIGILSALPHILVKDEHVESLSLGAGNTGRQFDLETTHRLAEFKFIQWRGGPESIRQNGLFKDFFYLAEEESDKERSLYLLELDRPLRFLNGRRALSSILSKDQRTREDFRTLYGNQFAVVRDYYLHRHASRVTRAISRANGNDMAIGKLVKAYVSDIFAYCDSGDHAEIERLLDREYSKRTFGLSFPFCKQVKDIEPTESKRFWADVYMVRGKQVRVISQWVEKHHPAFITYLVEYGIATEAEALEREDLWTGAPRGTTSTAAVPTARASSRVNARYRSYAIGNAQNAFIRNILSSLGQESFSERDWLATKEYFGNRCAYCGEDGDLLIEHAIPINRESLGEHRLGNIVPSCRKCNADKGGRDFRDFLGEDVAAAARIEQYMDTRNYVPLEDSGQMKLVLNMAHSEVAALADRYVRMINSVFPMNVEAPDATVGVDDPEAI